MLGQKKKGHLIMHISPLSIKTNNKPNFRALIFQIDRDKKMSESATKFCDTKFKDEFMGSLSVEDRIKTEDMRRWADEDKVHDIVISKDSASPNIFIYMKDKKTGNTINSPVCIGHKKEGKPMEIKSRDFGFCTSKCKYLAWELQYGTKAIRQTDYEATSQMRTATAH